jgi:hypothetical protein
VISGTAAAGAAIIGTATVKDSSSPPKFKSVVIATDGKYSVDVSGLTAPFMLRADGAVGGRRYSLFSAAAATDVNGTINITPLTDLILANVARDIAANYYDGGNFAGITKAALDAQIATLAAHLLPVLSALGVDSSLDLLRTSFNADHTGMDAVMDVLKVSVDPASKTATILNVINNSTLTQNIVTNSVSGTLSSTGVVGGLSALQQITDGFTAWAALYAVGLPTPAQVGALGFFDTANFLSDGAGYDEFVTGATSNAPTGMRFTDIAVVSADANGMLVHWTVWVGNRIDDHQNWLFQKDAATGKYLAWGNRRHMFASISAKAECQYGSAPLLPQYFTGLRVELRDPHLFLGGNGVVVVNGPGAVNENFVYEISSFNFRRAGQHRSDLIDLSDAQIASIPDVDAVYTIDLYDNTGGAMTLKETFTETVPKRPLLNSELSAAAFATNVSVTPASFVGFTGGTVSASWTLSEGLQSKYVYAYLSGPGNNAEQEKQLAAGDLSASLLFNPLGWTATSGSFDIGVVDVYGRLRGCGH